MSDATDIAFQVTEPLCGRPFAGGEFRLILPEYNEQKAITDYLDRETAKIDNLIQKVEAAIERLQEDRTALITAAVTGKIDVRQEAA